MGRSVVTVGTAIEKAESLAWAKHIVMWMTITSDMWISSSSGADIGAKKGGKNETCGCGCTACKQTNSER